MNDPHKFGTEFGSDNAPEHSAAIVSHHDSIKWFEAIPGEQLCIRVHGTSARNCRKPVGRSAIGLPGWQESQFLVSLTTFDTGLER